MFPLHPTAILAECGDGDSPGPLATSQGECPARHAQFPRQHELTPHGNCVAKLSVIATALDCERMKSFLDWLQAIPLVLEPLSSAYPGHRHSADLLPLAPLLLLRVRKRGRLAGPLQAGVTALFALSAVSVGSQHSSHEAFLHRSPHETWLGIGQLPELLGSNPVFLLVTRVQYC